MCLVCQGGTILPIVPQERRLVTVLFADMVGSTTLTVSNDAEVVRERLAGLFERARAVLEAHGATVEKFIGDAVMAVFGIPVTHEDDAERAVRAAHGLIAAFAADSEGPIQRIELRIGINTGEVATGSGGRDQFLATGEAVNLAARLQSAAEPGEILLGALTRRLVAATVRTGPARRVAAKGLGEIEAWPAEGLISEVPSGGHPIAADAQFVGRDHELARLHAALGDAAVSGRPRLITVVGDAGIGKTRLVEEFVATVSGTLVLRTRCPPYGEGLAMWPIEEILGPAGPDGPQHVVGAFRRHLEILAQDGPVALVIEDLHWAEPAFTDAIEHIVDRAHGPILVLCTARADIFADRPGWGSGRATATIVALGPLDERAVERLIGSLDASALAAGSLASVVAHGEGNPLFIQEYLRALREGDQTAVGAAVPPTLRALIAARLDRIPLDTRRMLQAASVLGRTFGLDALAALGTAAPGPGTLLEDAERLELVAPIDPAGVADRRFSFIHILYRDVAYAGLPKGERVSQHDRVSRWLEARDGDDVGVAAHHAEQAYALARELGAVTAPSLGRRAFDLLRRAGEGRRLRTDSHAALAFYTRALHVATTAVTPGETFEIRARAVIARLRVEGSAAAIAELDAIIPEARANASGDLLVQLLVWRYSISLLDETEAAVSLIGEAITAAEATGDVGRVTYARWAAAEVHAAAGDLAGQRGALEAARRQMVAAGATYWLVPCLVDLADNALERRDSRDADRLMREALLLSETGVSAINRIRSLETASRTRLAANDVGEASRYADAATVLARDIGEPWASARAAIATAACRRAAGDPRSAARILELALKDAESAARPTMRGVLTELRTAFAIVRAELGDRPGAEVLLAAARADAPRADARARRHIAAAAHAIDRIATATDPRA